MAILPTKKKEKVAIYIDGNNFYKYLKCPACQESGLYCKEHKKEVEKILAENELNQHENSW